MKKEYIERSGMLADLARIESYPWTIFEDAYGVVQNAPAEDVAPVMHGEWVFKLSRYEADECNCSLCGQLMTTAKGVRMNYCPNCGAKMDGGKRE
jgi:tRNA(Ile2) C34 agmatinyltransferase TiaS